MISEKELRGIDTFWKIDYNPFEEFHNLAKAKRLKQYMNEISITEKDIKKYVKSKQISLKDSTIKELLNELNNINNNFNDITYRQVSWVEFKRNIESLWEIIDNENSKSIILLVLDSVKNLKAEKMNKFQIKGFNKILEILSMDDTCEINLEDIIDIFIKYDIPALRFPSGTSDLLDR